MTGKEFEKIFQDSCKVQNVLFIRMRDAGFQGITNSENSQRFTIKNIADCIVFNGDLMATVELKHRKQALAFKDITQFKDLEKLHNSIIDMELQNATCGLLVCFDGDFDKIWWISIPALEELAIHTGKKSFNHNDCLSLCDDLPLLLVKVDSIKLPRKRNLRIDVNFLKNII